MSTKEIEGEVDTNTYVVYRYVVEGSQVEPEPEPKPEPEPEPGPEKIEAQVRVQYIDKSTNKKLTTDTIIEGYIGDKYNVVAKEFDGYELIEVPENASGEYKVNIVEGKETTETLVKLYYAKKATGRLPQTGEEVAKAIMYSVAFIANITLAIVIFRKMKSEDN